MIMGPRPTSSALPATPYALQWALIPCRAFPHRFISHSCAEAIDLTAQPIGVSQTPSSAALVLIAFGRAKYAIPLHLQHPCMRVARGCVASAQLIHAVRAMPDMRRDFHHAGSNKPLQRLSPV